MKFTCVVKNCWRASYIIVLDHWVCWKHKTVYYRILARHRAAAEREAFMELKQMEEKL